MVTDTPSRMNAARCEIRMSRTDISTGVRPPTTYKMARTAWLPGDRPRPTRNWSP